MVAINFQAEFVPDIRAGRKTQTIRRSERCKAGDDLQLYTGQRTKNCELIGTAKCAICEPITIADDYIAVGYFRLPYGDADHIAKVDGFKGIEQMRDWFRAKYGPLPFGGFRIFWTDFKPAVLAREEAMEGVK
jgi:hypothetical protein